MVNPIEELKRLLDGDVYAWTLMGKPHVSIPVGIIDAIISALEARERGERGGERGLLTHGGQARGTPGGRMTLLERLDAVIGQMGRSTHNWDDERNTLRSIRAEIENRDEAVRKVADYLEALAKPGGLVPGALWDLCIGTAARLRAALGEGE